MREKNLLKRTINEYREGINGLKNNKFKRFQFEMSVPWFAIDNEREVFNSFIDATIAISEKRIKELEAQLASYELEESK